MRQQIDTKGFWYDDEKHAYGLGEKHLGGFTEIFKSLGFIETAYYTEEGRDRGSAVHLLCQALDEGREIDESKIDDARTLGRFRAYKRFKDETGFRPILIEKPSYSAALMIACTPDRTGQFGANNPVSVIDLKGGAKSKWHPYQTAFQAIALFKYPQDYPRYALYLKDSGRYNLETHEDRHDFEVARAAAIIYHAKRGM